MNKEQVQNQKLEEAMSVLFNSLFCQKACQDQIAKTGKPNKAQSAEFLDCLHSLITDNQNDRSAKERLKELIKQLGQEAAHEIAVAKLCMIFDQGNGSDLQAQFINAYIKHQKWHETQSARCSEMIKEKPKYTAKIQEAQRDHIACLPSNLALLQCMQSSTSLVLTAKQLELTNKLFNQVAPLFELDAEPLASLEKKCGADLNLNQMILMHGQPQHNQGIVPRGIAGEAATTLDGDGNSTLRHADSAQSPDKLVSDIFGTKKKLLNFRANSEPPTDFNPTRIIEENSAPEESKQNTSKLTSVSGITGQSGSNRQKGLNRGTKVPPIMVNQLQQNQYVAQLKGKAKPDLGFNNTASSMVMNSFFNMPHGKQLYNTQSQAFQKSNATAPNTQKSSQYKFHVQNTLARSRLTRRQMSMSRQMSLNQGGSSNNLLKAPNPTNTKQLANRHASQPPVEDNSRFQETQILRPYDNIKDDIEAGAQKRVPISKTPIVPPINIQKLNVQQEAGPVSISPFQQAGLTHGGGTSTQQSLITMNLLTAQNVTSQSNNAFIANNYLLPGRSSLAHQTKSSRSPKSINSKFGDARPNLNIKETDSQQDIENNSFAFEMGIDHNEVMQQTAEEKLKLLAIQIGESCLTHDLSALMSQKRDLELAESARKIVLKPRSKSNLGVDLKRSQSTDDAFHIGKFKNRQVAKARPNNDPIAQRKKRLRVVLLNTIDILLSEYTNDEARFLKQPIALFNCFFTSTYFRQKRQAKLIKALKNCAGGKRQCAQRSCNLELYIIDIKGVVTSTLNAEPRSMLADVLPTLQAAKSALGAKSVPQAQIVHCDQRRVGLGERRFVGALCLPELSLISRMLSKFSFVNEEILRSQVLNELKNFTNRDKLIDMRLLNTLTNYNGYYLHQGGFNQSNYLHPSQVSVSPSKHHNRSQSFDNELLADTYDEQSRRKMSGAVVGSKPLDALQMLQNPNYFWSNNGVAYELYPPQNGIGSILSAKNVGQNCVAPHKLRKKLDVLLYHVSRSIRYVFSKNLEVTSIDFAEAISINIIALSAYLGEQKSRTLVHQFIEVCLEPLLMVKKALIDVALRSNILVMDFTKNMGVNELLISAKGTGSHINEESDQQSIQKNLQLRQKALRQLFSEFLLLVSHLLKLPQSLDTLKLLNETLIFDELWQESVKTFTISLFLCDLISTTRKRDLNNFQKQTLEDLRGVNIVNFDEHQFSQRVMSLRDNQLEEMAGESIKLHFLGAVNILRYFKAVSFFFRQAIQLYFTPSFERATSKPSATLTDQSHIAGGHSTKYSSHHGIIIGSGIAGVPGKDHRKEDASKPDHDESELTKQRKYWKHVIRRILYQLMFLITHPNGLFFQYLQTNAINYCQVQVQTNEIASPLNLKITKLMLDFMRELFAMPHKLTKYVFDEELLLFYIRTHYISFVKLYHKNYQTHHSTLMKETPETQRATEAGKACSIGLCKKHGECLFAIARNRTEETRRKLFQFKIVQFLLQEIGLEFELQQRRERFLKLSKQQEDILKQKTKSKRADPSTDKTPIVETTESATQQAQVEQQPVKKPFCIPKLKTGGLGLSTIVQENGKTQEENDFDACVKDSQVQQVQTKQPLEEVKKKPVIPMIKTGGLGLSTLVKENGLTAEEQAVQELIKPQSIEQQKPIVKMPVIPSLKTAGLGLSTIAKEGGKTQEELDVESQVKSNQVQAQPIQQAPAPVKRPMIPMLKTGGLGLSTLVKDGGKTQEELDVESQIKGKPMAPIQAILSAKSSATDDSNLGPNEVAVVQRESRRSGGFGNVGKPLNNDGGDSDSEMPTPGTSTRKQPQPVAKKVIPMLKVQGLGFSNLIRENGKTQEELDVDSQVKSSQMQMSIANQSEFFRKMDAPASVAGESQLNQMKDVLLSISDLKGQQQQHMLSGERSRANLKRAIETESKPDQRFGKMGLQVSQQINHKRLLSPMNAISGFAGSSIISSQVAESQQPRLLPDMRISEGILEDSQINMLSPPNQNQKSQSRRSSGSLVGRNEVFVPHLSFPDPDSLSTLAKPKEFKPTGYVPNRFNNSGLESRDQEPDKNKRFVDEPVTEKAPADPADVSPENTSKLSRFIQQDRTFHDIAMQQKKLIESQRHRYIYDSQTKTQEIVEEPKSADKLLISLQSFNPEDVEPDLSEEVFYMRERSERPIYYDDELHVLMLSLMMCLLLKPQRGTLDELYCSQFPILNEDQNVLYLLHFHLGHAQNQEIVPELFRRMEQISPPLAGTRLLKLLCPSLFDLSLYNNGKNWQKIAEGAYGIVFECQTNLTSPSLVAIKEMHLPQSIQDRCVLHDIFSEITCLEEFRLEPCVTDLYDYGVDQTSYYIVMKKYAGSIKDWRVKQKASMHENLSLYLSIYKEILRCFQIIHSHNVTHYDIKCDNVLIDFKAEQLAQDNRGGRQKSSFEETQLYSEDFAIAVADFGECFMYSGDRDAYSNKNRGTDAIKSPEMLLLALNTRKDTDKYDRRKREGTNSLSDVWSLGCLLFELLTGKMLFDTEDYIQFHVQLTSQTQVLLTQDKLEMINNNVYLIDFLKYILVRDMRLRPTIQNVIKRFEHVHALLVSTSSNHPRLSRMYSLGSMGDYSGVNFGKISLSALLDKATKIMQTNRCKKAAASELHPTSSQQKLSMPPMMRIMEDVFLSSHTWIISNPGRAIRQGITHLVVPTNLVTQTIRDSFDVFEIPSLVLNQHEGQMAVNPFLLMPQIMDFLRRAALFSGRILFVEQDEEWEEQQLYSIDGRHLVRECMLMCLATIYQTNAYETYTLIKSQNLFFQVDSKRLITISKWTQLCSNITHYLATYPRFSCICGSCVFVLKRQFANYSTMSIVACHCTGYYKNVEGSQCPSTGCQDFIQFLRTYFKQHLQATKMLADDQLHWGYLEEDDFVVGPNYSGQPQSQLQRQLASNLSQTTDKNSVVVGITEKTRTIPGNVTPGNNDLISRSSATRRNYSRQGGSYMGHAHYQGAKWKLFKCKECQVWTHAFNDIENKYAILLNNRVRERKLSRLGLLAGQNEDKSDATIRVPILERIKLKIPF